MRVSANKDTVVVARIVQKWRKPTNPISQGKLSSYQEPKQLQGKENEEAALAMFGEVSEAGGKLRAFSIVGTPHANTGVREIRELISSGKAFAVLIPTSLIPQIARGCNEGDMDEAIAEKVNQMTKIVMHRQRMHGWFTSRVSCEGMKFSLPNNWRRTRQIWTILSLLCKIRRMTALQETRIIFHLIACSQVSKA